MGPETLSYRPERRDAAAVVLVAVFIALALLISMKKSNTWDEPAHMMAGHAYLAEGMDYLSPLNHPVTGRMLPALLPYLLLDLAFDPDVKPEGAPGSNFFSYALDFLHEGGKAHLVLGRLMNILLGALLGAYVYVWSRALWGWWGGTFSLLLYALSPNVLAHSSLATTDMPITAFFFISVFYLWSLGTRGVMPVRVVSAALFISLALTSKHTALLLVPVFLVSFVSAAREGSPRRAAAGFASIFILAYIFIWALYGFRYHSAGPHYAPLDWASLAPSIFTPVISAFKALKILPEAYLYSIAGVLSSVETGKPAFLMGEHSASGWWYYFIIAFIIKTPVPTLLFLGASLVLAFSSRERRERAAWLVFPALVVFILVSAQKVNIGLRHMLPVYPFVFALGGLIPAVMAGARGAGRIVFSVLLAWYVYAAAFITPHQLAYFNELVGGPSNGYKYLVDSNLDWGQDLGGLKRYMERKGIERVALGYFGYADPSWYGIEYDYLPSFHVENPKNVKAEVRLEGWFAISATMLQGVYMRDRAYYDIFKGFEPVDTIGHSIFIYYFPPENGSDGSGS